MSCARSQRAGDVERYNSAVYGRVGDVIANVTVVQSFTRLKAEARRMSTVMSDLLAAQYPVLTWWGLLTVLQRAAATITMVAVLATGAVLAGRGELTVGEIVSFVAFAGLLIGKLDQVTGFVTAIHRRAPLLKGYFALVDEADAVVEKPDALPLPTSGAMCATTTSGSDFPAPRKASSTSISRPAGQDRGAGRAYGLGQDDDAVPAAAAARSRERAASPSTGTTSPT